MTKSKKPSNYISGIPRVSEIVESIFPFEGEGKRRFLNWLDSNGIDFSEYMKEASEGGTYVHKALEDYLNGKRKKVTKYTKLVSSGKEFIKDSGLKKIYTEHFISTPRYQGTIDLVAKVGNEEWVLDWKTYSLAKIKFQLKSKYKKPYDKLKKARLQLSLYAHSLGIKNIGVIELTEEGYHFHKLDLIPIEEINKILLEFEYNYVDNI